CRRTCCQPPPWRHSRHTRQQTSRRTLGRIGRRRGSRPGTEDTSSPCGLASPLVPHTPLVNPNGQREGERRPLAYLALDPDPPPVQLDELLGQRQPEPRALLLPGVVPADLAELLEDGRLVLGRDADPRVADGDRDDIRGRRGGEAHSPPLRRELH